MNRILFETRQPSYRLDPRDPRFEHVRGVLRMGVGDRFDVGVVNGPAGKATVTVLTHDELAVTVEWGDVPPPPPPVHLLVGLCRPATVRKILATVPTLGVRQVVFAATGRTDPAYARASLWTGDEWRRHLVDGVEQAFDTFLPEMRLCGSLAEAVACLPPRGTRLALDVYEGTAPLSRASAGTAQPVCLAVGPERGWDAADRAELRAGGFQLVSLNQRVLRVETAVIVGLTLLLAQMGVY